MTKLKAQNEYLEAVDVQDVEKLRALSSQYNILHTPVGAARKLRLIQTHVQIVKKLDKNLCVILIVILWGCSD